MKLLLLDIETAPHLAAVWGLWKQDVGISQILKPGYTLCWAAKWHGEKEVHFDSIRSGHKRMVSRIHKLMGQADAICHYNGSKFDIPTLNKEFLLQGLPPPAPSKQIDLLRTARSQFRLASNKLDFVAQALGLGKKLPHKGFELWLECMAKKPEAWAVMEQYNKQDVLLLEKVYDRLKPWVKSHPNRSVMEGHMVCPKCASPKLQKRGYAVTNSSRFTRFQCQDCGGWSRTTTRELGKHRLAEVA